MTSKERDKTGGFVQIALSKGDYVHIRQATEEEKVTYEKKLDNWRKK